MVTINWHRAYFVTSDYIFFDESCSPMSGINTLKHLMLREKLVLRKRSLGLGLKEKMKSWSWS